MLYLYELHCSIIAPYLKNNHILFILFYTERNNEILQS